MTDAVMPAYVNVSGDEQADGSEQYEHISDVLSHPGKRRQLVQSLIVKLQNLKREIGYLDEFSDIVAAIDRLMAMER